MEYSGFQNVAGYLQQKTGGGKSKSKSPMERKFNNQFVVLY